MASNKQQNGLIILLVVLAIASIGGMYYFYNRSVEEEKPEPAETVLADYQKLEDSYQKAIQELDKASRGDFSDVDILKQNLEQILGEIKEEKQKIAKSKAKLQKESMKDQKAKTKQLEEKLEMSKEVADAYLVQRLERMKQMNEVLQEENQELSEEKQQVEQNLQKIQGNYEEQKSQNAQLNAIVETISTKVEKLEEQGTEKVNELEQLKEKKRDFEQRLQQSNQVIENQSGQINKLTSSLRKVNLDCFFYFHKGDEDKEAKIYLTQDGVAKQYKEYFQDKNPDVETAFELNKDLFKDGVQKVNFQLFNSNDTEVFTTDQVIYQENLQVTIPSEKLETGKTYYIKLKNGDEDLIIGGRYEFRI